MFKKALFFLMINCLSFTAGANEKQCEPLFCVSPETVVSIKKVIYENYLGGQIIGSAAIIQSAFDKNAVMLRGNNNSKDKVKLTRWLDMHSLVAEWAKVPNPNLNIDDVELLSLDVIDERLATAQIRMQNRVYEVLNLVKVDGNWLIASKVYIVQ